MATPNAQHDPIETCGFTPETELLTDSAEQVSVGRPAPRDEFYWLNRAFYIVGAVAGVGFLVVLLGAYVIPNTVTVLIGTVVIVLAVIAWIFAAVVMVAMMFRHGIKGRGKRGSSS